MQSLTLLGPDQGCLGTITCRSPRILPVRSIQREPFLTGALSYNAPSSILGKLKLLRDSSV
jgi:hypothetical protein